MADAQWRAEGLELRLVREDERICCEVRVEGSEQPIQLGCAPVHLLAVSSGISYHFSGPNAICSLRRNGEFVVFEVQVGNRPECVWRVPLQEYRRALTALDVTHSHGFAC